MQTTPLPGWRISTEQRDLDEPIDLFGSESSTIVSEVIWTATGAGVAPGQFQDFTLSMGPLPRSGELVFRAVRTHSSGDRITWNEVAVDESAEPEHPAPVLSLTAPENELPAVGVAEPVNASPAPRTPADGAAAGAGTALPTGLSVVALLTALGALGVALKRRPE